MDCRFSIDYCISPQRTPQLNRRKKAFNGAGKERRDSMFKLLKDGIRRLVNELEE